MSDEELAQRLGLKPERFVPTADQIAWAHVALDRTDTSCPGCRGQGAVSGDAPGRFVRCHCPAGDRFEEALASIGAGAAPNAGA